MYVVYQLKNENVLLLFSRNGCDELAFVFAHRIQIDFAVEFQYHSE